MKPKSAAYDVYLSHVEGDSALADAVQARFAEAGLRVFRVSDLSRTLTADEIASSTWEANAESLAHVVILTPFSRHSPNMLFEVGAAWAWEKPILIITSELSPDDRPVSLRKYPAFPAADLGPAIEELRKIMGRFSESDTAVLTSVYHEFSIPVDQLLTDSETSAELVGRFNRRVKRKHTPDRVLQELLRLRKLGKLRPTKRAS